MTDRITSASGLVQALFPTVSVDRGERCQSAVCRRVTFMYGPAVAHHRLTLDTHESRHDLFGRVSPHPPAPPGGLTVNRSCCGPQVRVRPTRKVARRPAGAEVLPRTLAVLAVFGLSALFVTSPEDASGQETESLSMERAVELAQERSAALLALVHGVEELEHRSSAVRAGYFPQLGTQADYRTFESGRELPEGLAGGLFFSMTTLTQPVTQLLRVRSGHGAALAEADAARAMLHRARNEVALGTIRLFGDLLVARLGKEAAEAQMAAAEAWAETRRASVGSGRALEVEALEARVRELETRGRLVQAESRVQELEYELTDLLGWAAGTSFELLQPDPVSSELLPLEDYVHAALRGSPEVLEARASVRQAEFGVTLARSDYIPEVGVGLTHLYQSSFSFLPRNSFGVAVQLRWTLADFGKRNAAVGERRAQLAQARASLRLAEGRVRGEVEQAYRRLRHAELQMELAREARQLRNQAARLHAGQERAGMALAAETRQAEAEVLQGAVDLLHAEMGYRLAFAELQRFLGELVP
jgi:outer membrane protein TolC